MGDPNLGPETGNGVEISLRQKSKRARGEINLFYYGFNNFVFPFATGEFEDGLQVIHFTQLDSRFAGAEAILGLALHTNVWFNIGMDYVDAQETNFNTPLPRIPPLRGHVGLDFRHGGLSVKPELVLAGDQQQTFTGETRTPGYGVANLKASYTIPLRTPCSLVRPQPLQHRRPPLPQPFLVHQRPRPRNRPRRPVHLPHSVLLRLFSRAPSGDT